MEKAKLFLLGKQDMIKAFWMFLTSTVISVLGDAVMQAVNSGTYSLDAIHWREIGAAILVATFAYLKKNLLSNSEGEFLKKEAKDAAAN